MPKSISIGWTVAIAIAVYLLYSGCRYAFRIVGFIKSSRIKLSGVAENQVLQVNTPRGSVDLELHASQDAGLESIPKYPGGIPIEVNPGFELALRLPGSETRVLQRTYCTTDPFSVVLAYYEREFPNWKADKHFMFGEAGGRRFEERMPGGNRCIEIRCDVVAVKEVQHIQGAQILIRYAVSYGD